MSSNEQHSHVWTPGPTQSGDPLRIRNTADVLSLALAWTELPRFELLIAVLDVGYRVLALVTDPSPELIRAPGRCEVSGLSRPVHGVALLSMTRATPDRFDPPALFPDLQRHYRTEGIRLVDWVLIDFDPDGFRSMQLEDAVGGAAPPGTSERECVYDMRMARVNVYLPDELAEASRAAGLNVSRIAQDALRATLDATATATWLHDVSALPPTGLSHAAALGAVHAARDELEGG